MNLISLIIYFFILGTAFLISLMHWRHLRIADKIISVLLLLTITSEIVAELFALKFRNNMYVYHFFNPLQYFLLCAYYNESISLLKRKNTGLWIGIAGILFAVLNTLFLQPLNTWTSNFLLFESFVIIALSLVAYYELIKREARLAGNVHFWVSSIILVFWSFTFLYWGLYSLFTDALLIHSRKLLYTLWAANFFYYGGFGVIFLRYRKMIVRE